MKKSFWIVSIGIVALIIVAASMYLYSAGNKETLCGYDADFGEGYNHTKASIDACGKSCVNDNDCQLFVGSCININEKPYYPERLSVAHYAVNCSCENRVCVGKPTGEIMI